MKFNLVFNSNQTNRKKEHSTGVTCSVNHYFHAINASPELPHIHNLILLHHKVQSFILSELMRNCGKTSQLGTVDPNWSLLYCRVVLSMVNLVRLRFCPLPASSCMLLYVARTFCLPGQETSCCFKETDGHATFHFTHVLICHAPHNSLKLLKKSWQTNPRGPSVRITGVIKHYS